MLDNKNLVLKNDLKIYTKRLTNRIKTLSKLKKSIQIINLKQKMIILNIIIKKMTKEILCKNNSNRVYLIKLTSIRICMINNKNK